MDEKKKKRKKAPPPKAEVEQEKAETAEFALDEEFLRLKAHILAHLEELLLEPCDRGSFKNYDEWDDTLYLKINAFKEERGIYPNIMLARKSTYCKIDKVAAEHPDRLEWDGEGDAPDDFEGGLSCFCTDDFCIEFCLDTENELKVDEFKLIFDEDPTFDGEEEPSTYVRLRSA